MFCESHRELDRRSPSCFQKTLKTPSSRKSWYFQLSTLPHSSTAVRNGCCIDLSWRKLNVSYAQHWNYITTPSPLVGTHNSYASNSLLNFLQGWLQAPHHAEPPNFGSDTSSSLFSSTNSLTQIPARQSPRTTHSSSMSLSNDAWKVRSNVKVAKKPALSLR